MTETALRLLLIALTLGAAGDAVAQPPHWAFDHPLMPHRGRIGVQVQPMTPELREYFKAPSDRGVLVTSVDTDRPAARGGVRVGDVVVSGDGRPIRKPYDLVKVVGGVPAEGALELRVVRDGKERTLSVEPEGGPTPWVDPERWDEWLERGLRHGSERLRRRLEELEHRSDDLPGAQKTYGSAAGPSVTRNSISASWNRSGWSR